MLGVLIVIAFGALVVGFVMRLGGSAHETPSVAPFTLAPGMRIESMEVSGDRLVLRLSGSAGEEIDIIDTETGRLVSRLRSPQK